MTTHTGHDTDTLRRLATELRDITDRLNVALCDLIHELNQPKEDGE